MTSKTIRIDESTIEKLDKLGKEISKETGIIVSNYTQIIEYLLRKVDKK